MSKHAVPGDECPQCGIRMDPPDWHLYAHRWSRDHILPRERGGALLMDAHDLGPTRNWRVMCQSCNNLLAICGHCVGALACARAVAGRAAKTMCRRWDMLAVAQSMPVPGVEAAKAMRMARSVTQAARRKMPHHMPVLRREAGPRLMPADYIFPAVTAAERVWNLATLARRRAGVA